MYHTRALRAPAPVRAFVRTRYFTISFHGRLFPLKNEIFRKRRFINLIRVVSPGNLSRFRGIGFYRVENYFTYVIFESFHNCILRFFPFRPPFVS